MSHPEIPYRVGLGFDVHPFAPDRPLYLGGVLIPHTLGLAGHSDADVLLHAITDAIFGAIGSTDIGQHFPNADPRWKDYSSSVFLEQAVAEARAKGFRVGNVDATILAEQPKIAPHVPAIRRKLAALLGVAEDATSLKATTMERMGFVGRGEGIAAMAVVLLVKA
jgi:2-C-methyl-D-erythritol 2,4-cyclodiphosphate synthase